MSKIKTLLEKRLEELQEYMDNVSTNQCPNCGFILDIDQSWKEKEIINEIEELRECLKQYK